MSKKILAILLCLAMVCAFAACGAKTEEPTEAETTEAVSEEISEEVSEEAVSEEASEEATEAASEEASEEATEAASEEASEATSEEASEETSEEATEETTEAKKVPSTKAEIIKVYNDAVNGAISAKAGYHKDRNCSINTLEGGAILKISVAKEAVYKFLGVGTKEWDNAKGKAEYMGKASLTEADVTNATCEEKDGKYIIAIDVKDGSSKASASGKSDSSPLSRTGLLCGEGDKGEYDYKNAGNIHYALNKPDDGTALESAELKATKGKIKATIDVETGHLESLEISFNFAVKLINVKYTIAKISEGTGDADTVVKFTKFSY